MLNLTENHLNYREYPATYSVKNLRIEMNEFEKIDSKSILHCSDWFRCFNKKGNNYFKP